MLFDPGVTMMPVCTPALTPIVWAQACCSSVTASMIARPARIAFVHLRKGEIGAHRIPGGDRDLAVVAGDDQAGEALECRHLFDQQLRVLGRVGQGQDALQHRRLAAFGAQWFTAYFDGHIGPRRAGRWQQAPQIGEQIAHTLATPVGIASRVASS